MDKKKDICEWCGYPLFVCPDCGEALCPNCIKNEE